VPSRRCVLLLLSLLHFISLSQSKICPIGTFSGDPAKCAWCGAVVGWRAVHSVVCVCVASSCCVRRQRPWEGMRRVALVRGRAVPVPSVDVPRPQGSGRSRSFPSLLHSLRVCCGGGTFPALLAHARLFCACCRCRKCTSKVAEMVRAGERRIRRRCRWAWCERCTRGPSDRNKKDQLRFVLRKVLVSFSVALLAVLLLLLLLLLLLCAAQRERQLPVAPLRGLLRAGGREGGDSVTQRDATTRRGLFVCPAICTFAVALATGRARRHVPLLGSPSGCLSAGNSIIIHRHTQSGIFALAPGWMGGWVGGSMEERRFVEGKKSLPVLFFGQFSLLVRSWVCLAAAR
jgi:hypothetical protein